jgi:nucleotide-binding universal stress UspA family protein
MNRRDFLLFRTERNTRVVEISCRRLALRDLEWRLTRDATSAHNHRTDGEPPAVFDTLSAEQVLAELARDIKPDEILRIADVNWSLPDPLRRQIDAMVSGHRGRGGRVEQTGTSLRT